MKKKVKLLKFDVLNLNDRIYTKKEVEPCLISLKEKIRDGVLFGELGYPENYDVCLREASHKILDLYIEDDYLIGVIETLNNSNGLVLKEIIDTVVFRPSSIGTVNEDKYIKLEKILTFNAINSETDAFKGMID